MYDSNNGVKGNFAQQLSQLKQLRAENAKVLREFFEAVCSDDVKGGNKYGFRRADTINDVKDGRIFLKENFKSDEQAIGKCLRPSLLTQYIHYEPNHLRDFLRFKCCTGNVEDSFLFMAALVQYGMERRIWTVVKLDIMKLGR